VNVADGLGAVNRLASLVNMNTGTLELIERQPPANEAAAVAIVTGAEPGRVLLHPPGPDVVALMQQMLRGRREWLDVPGTSENVHELCTFVLASLGLPPQLLRVLAGAGTMQLTFHADLPPTAFEFPWEFTLAEATRPYRRRIPARPGRGFLIFRHYVAGQPGAVAGPDTPPASLLVVESAPDAIGRHYSFESERGLVESALAFDGSEPLVNPDRQALRDRVVASQPDIIHLAGVDARQGRALLGIEPTSPSTPAGPDGMFFRAGDQSAVLPFDDLADVLTSGGAPRLVSFNIYNSSIGALEVIRRGAHAALGFQGDVDDLVAEQFFASFYSQWRRSGWDLVDAFLGAWANLTGYADRVRGTGIVLWARAPLIEARGQVRAFRRSGTGSGTGTGAGRAVAAPKKAEDVADAGEYIAIEYEPPSELNYSLLHNNANIVPRLVIRRQKAGTFTDVGVEVTVSAGTQEAGYRATLKLDDDQPKVDLHDKVRVPLTSQLIRTLGESLFSTIYVRVRWGTRVLLEETSRVAFMPVDEWKYDDTNARWLPSFVFPRDPVVREIITAAQRYLVALRDDAGAGFDGYQSYEPSGATIGERSRNIDAQVQAIWWALVHDYALGYINPPPNYSDEAQRLRRPSEIIDGRRGTCIDLALLLAACLEWIEIYPVMFLLHDHAFPGYWRNEEESYKRFSQLSISAGTAEAEGATIPITLRDAHPDPWMVGRSRFGDVTRLVAEGHIVPLESVSLTSRGGFWPSVEEGVGNLRSKRQFHSMFDIRTARTARRKVTPLPIWSHGQ